MLSRELEQSLNLAIQKARENQHEYITVEHLLYGQSPGDSGHSGLRWQY